MPVSTEQAMIKNIINIIIPHPIPVQEQPRPKPNLRCSQSKSQSNNNSLSNPEKQPGREFIASSSYGTVNCLSMVSYPYTLELDRGFNQVNAP